jgi:Tfp pilus assembly protein PilV
MEALLKKANKIYHNNKGISMVETILAIALSVILLLSLITLTNFNIRNSLLVTENQDAITSANLILENLRSLKDQNFKDFVNITSQKCVNSYCKLNNNIIVSVSEDEVINSITPTSYFKVSKISDNELLLNIITRWKVGPTSFSSPVSTTFTNWRAL